MAIFLVAAKIRDIGHAHFRRLRRRRPLAILFRQRRIIVQRILDMHHQNTCFGLITESSSGDGHRA